jgi:hypothetical protein
VAAAVEESCKEELAREKGERISEELEEWVVQEGVISERKWKLEQRRRRVDDCVVLSSDSE